MAALTREDVEEIAHLARLALTEAELDRMPAELTAILAHMDALAELDTEGVAPMTHAVPMDLRLRPDDVQPSLPAEVALSSAPDPVDGFFRVPHIIKTASES
jgi:aspartyl-tRNA(Asn)/glutamyl-tRNA(Gln) amidotransferase subunit C